MLVLFTLTSYKNVEVKKQSDPKRLINIHSEVHMISISMCMIVKNEQSILKRCLDSYAGTYDELIIIDTGSTDNTKAIACQYTDKVYDFTWCDDFAAARNFAFSKAHCNYILSVDADEELDSFNNQSLQNLKSVLLPEVDIVQMYYVNNSSFNSVYNVHKELRPKLFKRLRTFDWISPIHETIRINPVIYDSNIEIMHKPTGNHSKRDFSVYFKALKKGIHLEDYVVSMLCKELFISGDDSDFIFFKDTLENTFLNENRSTDTIQDINCVLARIYQITGESDKFFKVILKAVADNPSSEICLILGYYYFDKEDYEEAAIWLYNAAYETKSILDIASSGKKPLSLLGKCYEKLAQKCDDDYQRIQYIEMSDDYYNQAKEWRLPEQ